MSADRNISRRTFLGRGLALGSGLASTFLWTGLPRRADAGCDLTTSDILGPYYLAGAPQRSVIASPDEPGTRLFLTGRVFADNCTTPLVGAIVDAWQASNAGCYSRSQPCPDEDPWNLRGQMLTTSAGEYSLETILPGYYPGRCRHIHWRVAPDGGPVLVTQLYFQGDPRVPTDPYASRPEAVDRIIPLVAQGDGLHGVFDIHLNVSTSDIGDEGVDPEMTYLHEGFPNPFRGGTRVRFSLASAGVVALTVFDSNGRRVRGLASSDMSAGYHTLAWDARDDDGRKVPAGIYFCQLTAAGRRYTRRLVRVN